MIFERTIRAGELPEALRVGVNPESMVLVSVRSISANYEQELLAAQRDAENSPAISPDDFIKELKSYMPQ